MLLFYLQIIVHICPCLVQKLFMTQTVDSVVNIVSRQLKLTGCATLTALSLATLQKYLSSSFCKEFHLLIIVPTL